MTRNELIEYLERALKANIGNIGSVVLSKNLYILLTEDNLIEFYTLYNVIISEEIYNNINTISFNTMRVVKVEPINIKIGICKTEVE